MPAEPASPAGGRHWQALVAGVVVVVLLVAGAVWAVGRTSTLPLRDIAAWEVDGNSLVDAGGAPIGLAGMSKAGTEYACVQGWGLFDGPVDDDAIGVMRSWGINAVRVPLNQSCWLGQPQLKTELSGAAYREAVRDWVDRLQAQGLLVLLELHLSAPGQASATQQAPMPDVDNSPDFWRSVAADFREDPGVAFELFNEPRDVSWDCWRDGCTMPGGWQAAGMQQLLDAVRSTGARQPVVAMGLGYGNDLSGWLTHPLEDPADQLVAGWHAYQHSPCNDRFCWDETVAPVAEQVPVLLSEVGQDDCGSGWLQDALDWADRHRLHYLAWTWNDWAGCGGPTLISDYAGTPTAQGAVFKEHLRSRREGT